LLFIRQEAAISMCDRVNLYQSSWKFARHVVPTKPEEPTSKLRESSDHELPEHMHEFLKLRSWILRTADKNNRWNNLCIPLSHWLESFWSGNKSTNHYVFLLFFLFIFPAMAKKLGFSRKWGRMLSDLLLGREVYIYIFLFKIIFKSSGC